MTCNLVTPVTSAIKMMEISLPAQFVTLLTTNTLSSKFSLYNFLLENKQVASLLDYSFLGFKWKEDKIALSSQGFIGIRNKLASLYLHYVQYGYFPKKPDLELLHSVLEMENKIADHLIDGYSRGFLLAFYLHLLNMDSSKNKIQFFLDDKTIELFQFTSRKVVKIDWLLILLEHFHRYLGFENIRESLKNSDSYENIYSFLKDSQKRELISNLLSYGQSIHDSELFFENIV